MNTGLLQKKIINKIFILLVLFFVANINAASYEQQLTIKAGKELEAGNISESTRLYREALKVYAGKYGEEHEYVAGIYSALANAYLASGENQNAIIYLDKALNINVKKFGKSSLETAELMVSLGVINMSAGDFKKSQKYFEEALEIQNSMLGKGSPKTLETTQLLAGLYTILGEKEKAMLLFKALEQNIKKEQKNDINTAKLYSALATLCHSNLDLSEAINYSTKALEIYEQNNDLESRYSLFKLHAMILGSLGREKEALFFYEENLKYRKQYYLKNQENPIAKSELGLSLSAVGQFYTQIGEYSKGLQLQTQGLEILESHMGSESPNIIPFLQSVAAAYLYCIKESCNNKNERAEYYRKNIEPLTKREYQICLQNFGAQNVRTADSIISAINPYDDWKTKIAQIDEALLIYTNSGYTDSVGYENAIFTKIITLIASNEFDTAKNTLLQNLSIIERMSQNPMQISSGRLAGWILPLYMLEESELAAKYLPTILDNYKTQLNSILCLDENTKLVWQQQKIDDNLIYAMNNKQVADFLFSWKGVILESLAEERSILSAIDQNGKTMPQIQKIKELQSKLSTEVFENPGGDETSKLKSEIGILQRELALKFLKRDNLSVNSKISISDILPALSNGGVLIDLIQFNDPKHQGDVKLKGELCFGAIITAENNDPVFVRVDGGSAINSAIDSLRSAINQGNSGEVEAQTKFLSEKLWQPVAAKIPEGAKKLYICPDANLSFLSFAALLESDGRFVAEKYPIAYIGSGRDLARKSRTSVPQTLALLANPLFDFAGASVKTSEMVSTGPADVGVFSTIELPPLPGTETEARSLDDLAGKYSWERKVYLAKDATEKSVRKIKKPGILHLATHGFYLNSFAPAAPEGSRGMSVVAIKETTEEKKKKENGVDPMRASGVALTGAQQTLQYWSQRKSPDPETDGVLTAEEVGALDLNGTWIVVLSACETGVGEARSGEGVFGLRRAFMIAGAQNLLMTLWPVADETTAKIMADFYKEAFATGDAAGSLAKVQRDWLLKLRNERGLLAAVREAGPFAMVVMANPNTKVEFVKGAFESETLKQNPPKSSKVLDFKVALAKADAGDAYAQAVVSIYYGLGLGCDQDFAKSKEYVMLSAKQQNPLGIYRLAEMRESGEGVDQNTNQATQLMQKAKPGLQKLSTDPYALTALATIYERENPASPKVRELLTKASDMGYEPAQTKLSQIQTNP